jgi:prephenate dehydrogenase
MNSLSDSTVTVIGLGLMGGSIAGALRGRVAAVVGLTLHPEDLEVAQTRGLVDRVSRDLAGALSDANVVVLATPVRVILSLIPEVAELMPPGSLLIDLGSTKTCITAKMAHLPAGISAIGGHPMCGRETPGIWAADPDLFRDRPFVLTPLPTTSADALEFAQQLVLAVGGLPVVLPADRHDRLVAAVSHLPYLLACSLTSALEEFARADTAVTQLAATGFRDASRLAASDVTMMLDILLTNKANVLSTLDALDQRLHHMTRLVASGDEHALRSELDRARAFRSHMRL